MKKGGRELKKRDDDMGIEDQKIWGTKKGYFSEAIVEIRQALEKAGYDYNEDKVKNKYNGWYGEEKITNKSSDFFALSALEIGGSAAHSTCEGAINFEDVLFMFWLAFKTFGIEFNPAGYKQNWDMRKWMDSTAKNICDECLKSRSRYPCKYDRYVGKGPGGPGYDKEKCPEATGKSSSTSWPPAKKLSIFIAKTSRGPIQILFKYMKCLELLMKNDIKIDAINGLIFSRFQVKNLQEEILDHFGQKVARTPFGEIRGVSWRNDPPDNFVLSAKLRNKWFCPYYHDINLK